MNEIIEMTLIISLGILLFFAWNSKTTNLPIKALAIAIVIVVFIAAFYLIKSVYNKTETIVVEKWAEMEIKKDSVKRKKIFEDSLKMAKLLEEFMEWTEAQEKKDSVKKSETLDETKKKNDYIKEDSID